MEGNEIAKNLDGLLDHPAPCGERRVKEGQRRDDWIAPTVAEQDQEDIG